MKHEEILEISLKLLLTVQPFVSVSKVGFYLIAKYLMVSDEKNQLLVFPFSSRNNPLIYYFVNSYESLIINELRQSKIFTHSLNVYTYSSRIARDFFITLDY